MQKYSPGKELKIEKLGIDHDEVIDYEIFEDRTLLKTKENWYYFGGDFEKRNIQSIESVYDNNINLFALGNDWEFAHTD